MANKSARGAKSAELKILTVPEVIAFTEKKSSIGFAPWRDNTPRSG